MTQTVFPAAGPDQVTAFLYVYDEDGAPASGIKVTITPTAVGSISGAALDGGAREETSAADGLMQFTGLFLGATYSIRSGPGSVQSITIPAVAADPYELPAMIYH